MVRSILLLVLCLVTLSNVQLGQSQCEAVRISATVYEILSPVLNDMKEEIIISVMSEIANISEAVSHLAEKLEDHMNETASEIASVNSELAHLGQLQSQSEAVRISAAVYEILSPVFNEMKEEIISSVMSVRANISEAVSHLAEKLEDNMNETGSERVSVNSELAHLGQLVQSKYEAARISAAVYEILSPVLNDMKEEIIISVMSEIANISEAVSHLAEKLEDHVNETASEIASVNSELAHLGQLQSQSEAVRISAAVYEIISPVFNEMKEEIISSVMSVRANISEAVSNLAEKLEDHVNETAFEIASVNSELAQLVRERSTAINETVNDLSQQLVMMNSSMRNDIIFVIAELSRANTVIGQKTTSAVAKLDTRLSSLNESMRDNFSGVERWLSGLKNTATLMYDTINNIPFHTCGGTGGWRRPVYLDMTDPNTSCPSGWRLTAYSKRTCGRVGTGWRTCDSAFFPVDGGPYTQVCGRIRAYQHGLPDAFYGYNVYRQTIDSAYVSGVALVHGSPRQHIWTFANGAFENAHSRSNCPCDTTVYYISIPPFVGEDYFCESGIVHGSNVPPNSLHLNVNDPLWDGKDCHSTSTCCALNNPPYFTKTLNQTTADELELRICLNDPIYYPSYDNIAVELVELYVK